MGTRRGGGASRVCFWGAGSTRARRGGVGVSGGASRATACAPPVGASVARTRHPARCPAPDPFYRFAHRRSATSAGFLNAVGATKSSDTETSIPTRMWPTPRNTGRNRGSRRTVAAPAQTWSNPGRRSTADTTQSLNSNGGGAQKVRGFAVNASLAKSTRDSWKRIRQKNRHLAVEGRFLRNQPWLWRTVRGKLDVVDDEQCVQVRQE